LLKPSYGGRASPVQCAQVVVQALVDDQRSPLIHLIVPSVLSRFPSNNEGLTAGPLSAAPWTGPPGGRLVAMAYCTKHYDSLL
jgi:hypothetical protein